MHFDVLFTLLVGKIEIGNILFLSRFQDIHLWNLSIVLLSRNLHKNLYHISLFSTKMGETNVILDLIEIKVYFLIEYMFLFKLIKKMWIGY